MKNKLSDLNNHLFAQLERLGNEELSTEQLELEKQRALAITGVAKEIVNANKIILEAIQLSNDLQGDNFPGKQQIDKLLLEDKK